MFIGWLVVCFNCIPLCGRSKLLLSALDLLTFFGPRVSCGLTPTTKIPPPPVVSRRARRCSWTCWTTYGETRSTRCRCTIRAPRRLRLLAPSNNEITDRFRPRKRKHYHGTNTATFSSFHGTVEEWSPQLLLLFVEVRYDSSSGSRLVPQATQHLAVIEVVLLI